MTEQRLLTLRLGSTRVGFLRLIGNRCTFLPDEAWSADRARPMLGQQFEDDPWRRVGVSGRVPSWFANLLPEGPMRHFLARGHDLGDRQEFQLVSALGADLPGRLVVERAFEEEQPSGGEETNELPPAPAHDEAGPTRFSLAGVQLKFSAASAGAGRGLVIPASGSGGNWIVKLADGRYPRVPANEFSMMSWAQHCGVDVPVIALVAIDEVAGIPTEVEAGLRDAEAFVIDRFDRSAGGRVQIEDFAQVLGLWPEERYGSANYTTLLRLVDRITDGLDVPELLRRFVMMLAMGNGDAHLKNWSLRYADGRTARLSPAYDLVCTTAYLPDDPLALTLAGTRDVAKMDLPRFARLLRKAEVAEHLLDRVEEAAATARDTWGELRADLPCSPEVKRAVDDRLASCPLFG